jgi:opacity protein-like surface antigen
MKKKIILIILAAVFLSPQLFAQKNKEKQNQNKEKHTSFFVALGSSVSTFIGGDLGSTFGLRITDGSEKYRNYNNYYNNYNYYKPYNNYNDNRNDGTFNPMQFDLTAGFKINEDAMLMLNINPTWHMNGDINPDFQTGYSANNFNYVDRTDNSHLLSIPLMLQLKVYPGSKANSKFYIIGGGGMVYIRESQERIRELYTYNGPYYGSYNYEFPLSRSISSKWLPGYMAGAGFSYNLSGSLNGDIELKYTNFINNERNNTSNLSLDRTPNIGNLSLGTKIFFNF